jgi:hypothetical protein
MATELRKDDLLLRDISTVTARLLIADVLDNPGPYHKGERSGALQIVFGFGDYRGYRGGCCASVGGGLVVKRLF